MDTQTDMAEPPVPPVVGLDMADDEDDRTPVAWVVASASGPGELLARALSVTWS